MNQMMNDGEKLAPMEPDLLLVVFDLVLVELKMKNEKIIEMSNKCKLTS